MKRSLFRSVEAIETCPAQASEELSQYYQNRAAAWEALVRKGRSFR